MSWAARSPRGAPNGPSRTPSRAVLASDATPRCASMASADRQMIGDETLARRSAAAASASEGLIHDSVSAVDGVIGQITTAASGQSVGIGQANQSMGEIDCMTQQNAALVQQSAAAAESLREQADRSFQVVQQFCLAQQEMTDEGHADHGREDRATAV